MGKRAPLLLRLRCRAGNAGAQAALAAGGASQLLALALEVEPSTAPAAIRFMQHGTLLPMRVLVRSTTA